MDLLERFIYCSQHAYHASESAFQADRRWEVKTVECSSHDETGRVFFEKLFKWRAEVRFDCFFVTFLIRTDARDFEECCELLIVLLKLADALVNMVEVFHEPLAVTHVFKGLHKLKVCSGWCDVTRA